MNVTNYEAYRTTSEPHTFLGVALTEQSPLVEG